MRLLVALLLVFCSLAATAQLREFDTSPILDPGTHVVQANAEFPDYAILLVYTTFDNLTFRSSMSAIGKTTYNAASGRYEILVEARKQVIFVAAPGFIESPVGTISPSPKQAMYFKVDEKLANALSGRGTIEIQSDPSDATILLNENETVYRTPSTREFPAGPVQISLRKSSYLNFDTVVRVKPNERVALHAYLTPAWAELSVNARPGDATISIGNHTAVGSMNLVGASGGLVPGTYTLRVERASHRTYSQTITLRAGQQLTLSPVLEEIRGRLNVTTQPAGASVRIGDRYVGQTPLQTDLLVGTYAVRIEKAEYSAIEQTVTIRENQTEYVNPAMTRGKQITINSLPEGAQLSIDGRLVGGTPRTVLLTFGGHKIEVRNGTAHESENIQVADGGQTGYTYDVRETVRFTVTSRPSDAAVYLDGQAMGITPLTLRAKTGSATLRVGKEPRWAEESRDVIISESANFDFQLSRDPAWDEKRTARLNKIYPDGGLFELFRGPLQYMNRADRPYLVLPSLMKLYLMSDKFTRGESGATAFFAIGLFGETQVNKNFMYYEIGSASLGFAFANPTHRFRLIVEGRAGYSYEWNYNQEKIKLGTREVSAWMLDTSGKIDRSKDEPVKSMLTPGMLRVSVDLLLFGKTYLEVSAGAMMRTEKAKWYYTDEVKSSASTFTDPTPVTNSKLPTWPGTDLDTFWAVGLRF